MRLNTNKNETMVTSTMSRTNTGIEHFEIICNDSLEVSQQVNKLLENTFNYENPSSTLNNTLYKDSKLNILIMPTNIVLFQAD